MRWVWLWWLAQLWWCSKPAKCRSSDSCNLLKLQVQQAIKTKEAAREALAKRYSNFQLRRVLKIHAVVDEVLTVKVNLSCSTLCNPLTRFIFCLVLQEDIMTCLYSIGDNNSFLLYNRDPVDRMIEYLKKYFKPGDSSSDTSLSICMGQDGARLSHNHERCNQWVSVSVYGTFEKGQYHRANLSVSDQNLGDESEYLQCVLECYQSILVFFEEWSIMQKCI